MKIMYQAAHRRLLSREIAGSNENPMLELSRYGQYRDRKSASGDPEAMGAGCVFLVRNTFEHSEGGKLMGKLKMDHVEVVESVEASGSLLVLWCNPVVLEVMGKTKNFIDVYVGRGHDNVWCFTGMYG